MSETDSSGPSVAFPAIPIVDVRYRIACRCGWPKRRRDRCRAGAALSRVLRGDGRAADAEMAARRRDFDRFDDDCDHLLVIDHAAARADGVVGTYRLIRRAAAARHGRLLFRRRIRHRAAARPIPARCWSSAAPASMPRLPQPRRPCSCCGAASRPMSSIIEIDADVRLRQPAGHRSRRARAAALLSLSLPSGARRRCAPRALPDRYVEMDRLSTQTRSIRRAALAALPPLIKGYLRLGGFVGDGAVIDRQFNTTDVCDRGEDRSRHRQVLSPLRAPGGVARGCCRRHERPSSCASSRIAVYLAVTLPADAGAGVPGLATKSLRGTRTSRVLSPLAAAACSAFASSVAARPSDAPADAVRRPTTSPISISRCWARRSTAASSPRAEVAALADLRLAGEAAAHGLRRARRARRRRAPARRASAAGSTPATISSCSPRGRAATATACCRSRARCSRRATRG